MNFSQICILLLGVLPAVYATKYCNPELCPGNRRHVACGNNYQFGRACGPNRQLVNLTHNIISQIVNKHNKLRNLVAGGFEHLPPADHMATIEWDNELAKLAELNVKQCQMKHDECRSTDRFRYAGQNLAMAMWYGFENPLKNFIDQRIQNWFDEYRNCPSYVIDSYPQVWNGEPIGHFTAMVQQKSNRIGCAVSRDDKGGKSYQYIACNYAFTNMIGDPVYSIGRAASKCLKRNNPKYPNLCSTAEVYNLS